jgi:hypothetical protein
MQPIHLTLLAAILAASNARELLPSRTTILPPKEPKDRLLSSTSRAPLQRRQADFDTLVEVGSGTTVAQDLSSEGASPQAFAQLWDWIENEACTSLGCSSRVEHCVTASTGQDVCVTVGGDFPSKQRLLYLKGARGAFDRSVRTRKLSSGVIETATDMIRLLGEPGNSSGYNIDVEIYNQDRGRSGEGCPDTIKIIAAAGANIPEIGTAFGTVSFMCDEVEWEGEATG